MIVNGVIVSQDIVEKILEIGFECLGEISPFVENVEDIVFTRSLSLDEQSVIWFAYRVSQNKGLIMAKEEDGMFDVNALAKDFASIACHEEFMQIQVRHMRFNHLEAIRYYESL